MGIKSKYDGMTSVFEGGDDISTMNLTDIVSENGLDYSYDILDFEKRTVALAKIGRFSTDEIRFREVHHYENIVIWDGKEEVDDDYYDSMEERDSPTLYGFDGWWCPNPALCQNEWNMVYEFLTKKNVDYLYTIVAIEDYACENSTGDTVRILADTITSIGEYAFYGCDNLLKVELSCPITEIEEGTFCKCPKIEKIELPNTLTAIRKHAFSSSSKVNKIICPATTPPSIDETAFNNDICECAILFVPKGTIEAYKNSDWKNFKYIEELNEDGTMPEVSVETIVANAKSVCNVNINFSIVETDKGLLKLIANGEIIDDGSLYIDAASKIKKLYNPNYNSLQERLESLKIHIEEEQNSEKSTTTSTANNIFEDVKAEAHLENNNLSIFRLKSNTIKVLNNGVEMKNAMDGIRAMAFLVGYKVNEENSNTRQEGAKLIDFINGNKK